MTPATGDRKATLTLPTESQVLVTREFDAPRHLVYRAWTTPELGRRWWHAGRGEMTMAEIDLRVGGRWRYAMVTPDGMEVAFHGEYREIVPDERIVSTEVYEMPGVPPEQLPETINTVTLAEHDGGTTMTVLIQCPSAAVREAILGSGMEAGMNESYELLEQVAQALA